VNVATTNLLLVDDDPDILAGLRRVLHPRRHEWAMTFAAGGAAAVEQLDRTEFDVVVADLRMPLMDGAELLGIVRRRQPSAVRIVLSGTNTELSTVQSLPVAHQFLAKPCDPAHLRDVIERSLELRSRLNDPAVLRTLGGLSSLPSPSHTVLALQEALGRTNVDPDEVATIVGSDAGMTTKLLQVANSAFYGLPRTLDDPAEAVRLLGAPVVAEIVVSSELLNAIASRSRQVEDSLDELRGNAMCRAELASALALRAGRPVAVARRISTDALLADIGELLFVSDPSSARDLPERVRRTAGAALLATWGLPHHLVETAVLSLDIPNDDAPDGHRFTWLAAQLIEHGHAEIVDAVAAMVGLDRSDLEAPGGWGASAPSAKVGN
jgi:HD-like signal output (HDOD) protein/ActR/RegA family two-component response regulator